MTPESHAQATHDRPGPNFMAAQPLESKRWDLAAWWLAAVFTKTPSALSSGEMDERLREPSVCIW